MGRIGGSYSATRTMTDVTAGSGVGDQGPSAALLSARSADSGDWPVSPSNAPVMSSTYFAPTRNNNLHYIYAWCSSGYRGRVSITSVLLHICTIDPMSVSGHGKKDKWNGQGSAMDADKLGIIETLQLERPGECVVADGWLSVAGYEACYVVLEKLFDAPNDDVHPWSVSSYSPQLSYYNTVLCPAPSLDYDDSTNTITVGTSMAGRRILEFYDTSYVSPTGISDPDTLMNFYLSSLMCLEQNTDYCAYYYEPFDAKLLRWKPGTYSVSLTDSVGDNLFGYVSSGLDNAILELSGVLGEFGISLRRDDTLGDSADIPVTYGTMKSLWNESSEEYLRGGGVEYTSFDGSYITSAKIGISKEAHYFSKFSSACFEELYQCFGCPYDQWEYPYYVSDHNEVIAVVTNEMGGPWIPDYMTQRNADMLRLAYSDAVNAGDDVTAVALAHNIPRGVKGLSKVRTDSVRTASLDFLNPGRTYKIRVWVIENDGTMSEVSDWLEITTPDSIRPANWDWEFPIVAGQPIKVRAQDWMDFCARINEFRAYVSSQRGDGFPPPYGAFVTVTPNTDMSATAVSHAVYAISAMNPPTAPPADVKGGGTISASFFNGLRDALNSIP